MTGRARGAVELDLAGGAETALDAAQVRHPTIKIPNLGEINKIDTYLNNKLT